MALSRRDAWPVAIVAMLTMTVSYVDRQTFNVLAPTITKELDISEFGFGVLGSAFAFAYLFATPLSGWWIERIGARRGLLASVGTWSGIAALHALIPGFGMLFALRLGLAFAEGPSFPGAAQTMLRALPPADRSRGFGLLFTGSSIGSMIAPPLVTKLWDLYNWRVALLVTAAIGLSWVPMWLAVTSRRGVAEQLDKPPQDVEHGPRPRFRDMMRRPSVVRAFIAVLAVAPATGFFLVWGSKFLVRAHGLKQGDVGGYLWLPPLCLDLGAIGFGDLFARTRRPRMLAVIAMAMALCAALVPFTTTPWASIAAGGVMTAGGGALYTVITSDVMTRVPSDSVSVVGGLIAAGQSLAFIIVSPIVGSLVDKYQSYDIVLWGVAAWTLPGMLVWLAWKPRE
jgi:ACS family hexuronate transporter-like MFS transporter